MSMIIKRVFPFFVAIIGFCGVIYVSAILRKSTTPKEPPSESKAVSFEVATDIKPPPKSQPKPKSRPKNSTPPPAPMFSSSLAGLQFGLAGLNTDIGGDGSGLLSDEKNDVVMTIQTVDLPPRPVQRSAASYPKRARRNGIEGEVTLSMLIDLRGTVLDVVVIDSEPPRVFDQSAIEAVKTWRFQPGEYEGKPVSVRVSQTLRFKLGA